MVQLVFLDATSGGYHRLLSVLSFTLCEFNLHLHSALMVVVVTVPVVEYYVPSLRLSRRIWLQPPSQSECNLDDIDSR